MRQLESKNKNMLQKNKIKCNKNSSKGYHHDMNMICSARKKDKKNS